MEWLTTEALVALMMLTMLEIILGIDNIVFISILTGKLPEKQRPRATIIGLGAALIMRIILLIGIKWVMGLVEPLPIKAMGRFEHEACRVHQPTGNVYMTEDRHHSLFYRYLPNKPGMLREGGRLQALAITGWPSMKTHNWSGDRAIEAGEPLPTHWVDLDDVDPATNDLRRRGAAAGAATFARGEGLCATDDGFAFTCTIGGRQRLGQIFLYQPGPFEGQDEESGHPGQLTLLAESTHDSLLRNADNIIMAPWGDLIACEDTASHCGLVGVRADGSQYQVADNAYSYSELAGACFAPDGKTLFVNIQYPGMTLAITGPWPN